jgi:hypothetical protein
LCMPGVRPTRSKWGADPVPLPFRQHLPGESLPDPGQPLPPLSTALLKHQLDSARLRMPPPSKPAAPAKPAALAIESAKTTPKKRK